MKRFTKRCECQDSNGAVCNKQMTKTEYKQDGMCASHVWNEMMSTKKYLWEHER